MKIASTWTALFIVFLWSLIEIGLCQNDTIDEMIEVTVPDLMDINSTDIIIPEDDELQQSMATIGPTDGEEYEEGIEVETISPTEAATTMFPSSSPSAAPTTNAPTEGPTTSPSDAPSSNPTWPEIIEATDPPFDGPIPTFPPEIEPANIQEYNCSVTDGEFGPVPSNETVCNEYKAAMKNDEECGCYYFCTGGGLTQCLDKGEIKQFGCSGGAPVIACFEFTADEEVITSNAATQSVDSVKEAMDSLYYTAGVALGAILCVL